MYCLLRLLASASSLQHSNHAITVQVDSQFAMITMVTMEIRGTKAAFEFFPENVQKTFFCAVS